MKLPFADLLNGITICLSGYVNPQRTEIRELALSMGAQYSPSYDPEKVTHLM